MTKFFDRAKMKALGKNITVSKLYKDASGNKYPKFFRDILKGINGKCGAVGSARRNYDTVTGLGSPLTAIY